MTDLVYKGTIQQRVGTAAQWTSSNRILLEGEIGIEKDTKRIKFGDGTTAWNDLEYYTVPGATEWGLIEGTLEDQTDLQEALDLKYDDISDITLEHSGFTNNENITVTYNQVARTVTLQGTFEGYYHGEKVTDFYDGWTSSPHPENPTTTLFLKYNSNGFEWQTTPWNFHEMQIAYVCYESNGDFCFAQREVHGLMPWQSHEEFHETIGTYRTSGGDLSSYVLGSTIATERRPITSQCIVKDEDLSSTLSQFNGANFSIFNLSGSNTGNFSLDQSEILLLSVNRPYYNQFVTNAWQQTLIPNGGYMCLWQVAIPVTADTQSQKHRFFFIQGQSQGNLVSQQALNPQDLSLGGLSSISPEFVFINKIIIQYTGGNWNIAGVTSLRGNKFIQTGSPSGAFLSQVSTNETLEGQGTPALPLKMADFMAPCGFVEGGEVVGSLSSAYFDVLAAKVFLRTSNSDLAPVAYFELARVDNISAGSEVKKYIYLDYNAGSPVYATTEVFSDINNRNKIFVGVCYYDSTFEVTFSISNPFRAVNLGRYLQEKAQGISRKEGVEITSLAGRDMRVSAGVVYKGLTEQVIGTFTTDPGLMEGHYSDGAGGYLVEPMNVWDNTQYDNGSGMLATLTDGKYSCQILYLRVENQAVCSIFGGQYDTLEGAITTPIPNPLPARFDGQVLFLGRICFLKGASTGVIVKQ